MLINRLSLLCFFLCVVLDVFAIDHAPVIAVESENAASAGLAPLIVTQPTSVKACNGSSALFTVTTVDGVTSYRWEVSTDGGTTWGQVGTSASTLVVPNITAGMNLYQYRCVVAKDGSSETSAPAVLTVGETLVVNAGPDKAECMTTDWYNSFNWVSITGSTNAAVYSWSHNGYGFFKNENSLTPQYVINPKDRGRNVRIILTAFGSDGCLAVDEMILTVKGKPQSPILYDVFVNGIPKSLGTIKQGSSGAVLSVEPFCVKRESDNPSVSDTYFGNSPPGSIIANKEIGKDSENVILLKIGGWSFDGYDPLLISYAITINGSGIGADYLLGNGDIELLPIASPWDVSTVTWNTMPQCVENENIPSVYSAYPDGRVYFTFDISSYVHSWITGDRVDHGFMVRVKAPLNKGYKITYYYSSAGPNSSEGAYSIITEVNSLPQLQKSLFLKSTDRITMSSSSNDLITIFNQVINNKSVEIPMNTSVINITASKDGCILRDRLWAMRIGFYADAGPDRIVPIGTDVTLSANVGTGYSYKWYWGSQLLSTSRTFVARIDQTKTFRLEVSYNGSTDIDEVTVSVELGGPVVFDNGQCEGDAMSVSAAGYDTYRWAPAEAFACPTCSSSRLTAKAKNGAYTLTGTVNGTTVVKNFNINISPKPVVTGAMAYSVCPGESVQFQLNAGTGNNTYQWDNASGLSSTTVLNPTATPAESTGYTLTVTNAGGCTSRTEVVVNVVEMPELMGLSPQSICRGQSADIALEGDADWVRWSPTVGVSNPTGLFATLTPYATTNYTVTAGKGGCETSGQFTVTVRETADAGFSYTSVGQTVTFTANADIANCRWVFGDGTVVSGGPRVVVHNFAAPGVYPVCLELDGDCGKSKHCADVKVVALDDMNCL
jgi:hypothetical protein